MSTALRGESKRNGWQEVKLGDVVEIFDSKRVPLSKMQREKMKLGKLYPYYGAATIMDYVNDYIFEGEYLLFAEDGTVEKNRCPVLQFTEGKFWVNNHTHVLRAKPPLTNRGLYYLLVRTDITSAITGAVQPKINQANLLSIKIQLPPPPEQKAITEILSSLDDKIDLLHRQNKTLENLAQALFRKWFIENPDRDNWEEKPLDEIADYLNGLACQKHPPTNETDKLPVLKIRELGGGINEKSDWVTSQVDSRYIVRRGDVIFSWSGSLMVKLWGGEECVLNQHLFKVTSNNYPKWYIYLWTKHHINKFIQIANSKATTMGHIKRGDLANSMAIAPTADALKTMSATMTPLFDKLIANSQNTTSLNNFRNTLLPRLISGKTVIADLNNVSECNDSGKFQS